MTGRVTHSSCCRDVIFVMLVLLSVGATAQNSGWRRELNNIPDKMAKVQWILAETRKPDRLSQRLPMLRTALSIAQELHNDTLRARSLHGIGYHYQQEGNMREAWTNYQLAKVLYLKRGIYDKVTQLIYMQCQVYMLEYLPDSLISFVDRNRWVIQQSSDKKHQRYLRVIYAAALQMIGKKENALHELNILLPLAMQEKDSNMIMSTCMNIATLKSSFDSSMWWYNLALSYAGPHGANPHLDGLYAEALFNIGHLYNGREDVRQDSALYYFLEAEKNIRYLNPVYVVELYNLIGGFFFNKNENRLALDYYKKAYGYADAVDESKNIAVNNLAMGFIRNKQLDSAGYYLRIYEKELLKANDAHTHVTFYETKAAYESARGDSCSLTVLELWDKALSYAVKVQEFRQGKGILIRAMECLKQREDQRQQKAGIARSILGYCGIFHDKLKSESALASYARFLDGYAALEFLYGSREKSYQLHRELITVLNRMNNADYLKGVDESIVKYKSELKDVEIGLLKEKEKAALIKTRLIAGVLILIFIILLLVFILYKRENKNRKVLDERNHKVEQLLREIHHRVKNNLQIVSSFINIQLDKITDAGGKEALQDTSTRIMALAGLHQSLYRQGDLSEVQLNEYIEDLCKVLGANANVKINYELENLQLDIDQAIPIGLAINELITNSLKHAFTGRSAGEITVTLSKAEKWSLMIKDNGIGLPDNLQPDRLASIGMRLVKDIIERQLKGKFSFYNDEGAVFRIEFAPTLI